MKIAQIYKQYKIMPSLQQHHYRVAAVGDTMVKNIGQDLDATAIITACLLHDLGNIIKFDLNKPLFPQFIEPEGLEYWLEVQREFFDRYGDDEHQATLDMCREIGASELIIELVDAIGFGKIKQNYLDQNIAKLICDYADSRVTPLGITTLEVRLNDLENRYAHKYPSRQHSQLRAEAFAYTRKTEAYLFSLASIKPEDINDLTLHDTIARLEKFEILAE